MGNILGAHVLATQGPRAAATMILTILNRDHFPHVKDNIEDIARHDIYFPLTENACYVIFSILLFNIAIAFDITSSNTINTKYGFYLFDIKRYYSDGIVGGMASQITSLTIVYSTVYSGADQRNDQISASWPLWGEFTADRWIPLTKGQ